MHPLAHMLTGALIGQVAPTPLLGWGGGLVSHYLLDAVPHTEAETFDGRSASVRRVALIEAVLEAIVGGTFLLWLAARCPAARPRAIGLGVIGALLPDLIDVPLRHILDISPLHAAAPHHTVPRAHLRSGIAAQVSVAAGAALALWRVSRC